MISLKSFVPTAPLTSLHLSAHRASRTTCKPHRHHHQFFTTHTHSTVCFSSTPDLDSLLGNLDVPEIEADLAGFQSEDGAIFDDNGVPITFRNDGYAIEALEKGVAITDLTHWGRIRLNGPGAGAFLHGQSTNDMTSLPPGTGCDTVLVTPQARCIDILTCYIQQSGIMCITSPDTKQDVITRLDKYIFPTDQVTISDISSQTAMFAIAGPDADKLLKDLQADAVVGQPWWSHTVLGVSGKPVIIAVGPLLSIPGYIIIADEGIAPDLWKSLVTKGATPMGSQVWEVARVINGRPAVGKELTMDYNPLEAGLYQAVSVEKGCYVGQETISKVNNLDAVKQQLWGLNMQGPCVAGDVVYLAADGITKLGVVTSAVDIPTGGHRALAYLKRKVSTTTSGQKIVQLLDTEVVVGGVKGRVVAIPYASRSFPESENSSDGGDGDGKKKESEDAEVAAKAAAAKAEAEERRQAKLKAMQERLAAWQAEQDQQ